MGHGGVLRGDEIRGVSDHGSEKREQRERWNRHFLVGDVVVVGVQTLVERPRRQAIEGRLRVAAAPLLFRQSRRGHEGVRRRRGDEVMEGGRTVGNLAWIRGGRWLPVGLGKGAETASCRQRDLIHAGQVFLEEVIVRVIAFCRICMRSQMTVIRENKCLKKERRV